MNSKTENDLYICYCEKITYRQFNNYLNNNDLSDFNSVCKSAGVARQCAACMANLEDLFVKNRGYFEKSNIKNNLRKKDKSFLKHIISAIDFISGTVPFKLEGIVPILYNKEISTWLVISNFAPKKISHKPVPYRLFLKIYDSEGKLIKTLDHDLLPNQKLKICLSDYFENYKSSKKINCGSAHLIRYSNFDGLRGSTRPHFYLQGKGSLASVHTQDGGVNNLNLNVSNSDKIEKKMVFVSNTKKKTNKVSWAVDSSSLKEELEIKPFGSKLIHIPDKSTDKIYTTLSVKSSFLFKPYLIISTENYDSISVDHVG